MACMIYGLRRIGMSYLIQEELKGIVCTPPSSLDMSIRVREHHLLHI